MKARAIDAHWGVAALEPATFVLSHYELGLIYGGMHLYVVRLCIDDDLQLCPPRQSDWRQAGIATGRMNQIREIIGKEAADNAADAAVNEALSDGFKDAWFGEDPAAWHDYVGKRQEEAFGGGGDPDGADAVIKTLVIPQGPRFVVRKTWSDDWIIIDRHYRRYLLAKRTEEEAIAKAKELNDEEAGLKQPWKPASPAELIADDLPF